MRKAIRNRLGLYMLYAALAIMFWFFDLMILAWIFAGLFLLPVIIGGVILVCNQDVTKGGGAYQPTVDNTTTPPRNQDVTECDHQWKLIHWNADYPSGLVKCTSCGEEKIQAYQ